MGNGTGKGRRSRGGRRKYGFAESRSDAESGRLTEVFACGTAMAITPIGTIRSAEGEFQVAGEWSVRHRGCVRTFWEFSMAGSPASTAGPSGSADPSLHPIQMRQIIDLMAEA